MTVHSGARQWRHDCECAPEVAVHLLEHYEGPLLDDDD